MHQPISDKKLRRWSQRFGKTFVAGHHRGGPSTVTLTAADGEEFVLFPGTGDLIAADVLDLQRQAEAEERQARTDRVNDLLADWGYR